MPQQQQQHPKPVRRTLRARTAAGATAVAAALLGLPLSACVADRAVTSTASLYPREVEDRHPIALTDARGPQWTKVVFNAATSPLAALTGLTVGQVCTDDGLRPLVDQLIDEALGVCRAAGIELLRDPQEAVQEAIDEAYGHKPSMLQDVLAHRTTEVDVLNGGIVAEAERLVGLLPG